MLLMVAVSLSVIALIISGCGRLPNAERMAEIQETPAIEAVDLGNGLYLVRATDTQWVRSLQKFVADHPNLRITAIAAGNQSSDGWDFEKVIVTEPRER
jgi:hypothetical protein